MYYNSMLYTILFVLLCFLEIGSFYIALTFLDLTMLTRLAGNSLKSSCVCFSALE